jgi:integrase
VATVAALTEPRIYFDSEPTLRGFGVRVRRDHSGKLRKTFIMQYRHADDDGTVRQRRQKLGEFPKLSAEKARTKARAWREKIDKGIDPAGEREAEKAATALTFSAAVALYLAKQRERVREQSLRLCTTYLTGKHFRSLHRKPVSKVSQGDVNICLDAIKRAPSARQAHKHLSAFYVWCMKRGHAAANPCLRSDLPENNPPRERVLSDAELKVIWNACSDDDCGKVIKLLMLSGCRAKEIGELQWPEIDFDAGVIRLSSERTKTGHAHTVPITDLMRDIIESIPRRVNRDYLFGERASGFTSWAQRATLGDGIAERWTQHDLRRTFRTGLGRLGVPPHVAELCVNHRKGGIAAVYDKYNYEGEIAAAFVQWDTHVRAIITGTVRKVVPLRA